MVDFKNIAIIMKQNVIPMIGRDKFKEDEMEKILYDRILLIANKDLLRNTKLEIKIKEYIKDTEKLDHIKIPQSNYFLIKKLKKKILKQNIIPFR